MTTFRSRYEEAQELAQRARRERDVTKSCQGRGTGADASGPLFETPDERLRREYREDQRRHFAEIAAFERDAVKDRIECGFKHRFGMEVGGRFRAPFTEPGLRSETLDSIAARYFVACVPAAGRLRTSMDKATLDVQARSKLLSLDFPWIEANKKVLSVIRIDCDRVFASPGDCIAELRDLAGCRIPCLPHLVTGDLLADGRFSRPHFYFLLPQGCAVWNDPSDPRCRMDIVKMFQAVSMGLVAAMLEIGADPCALTLTLRGKNPLSPYWHTICPNDTIWPTLSDYATWVDMSVSREKLARRAAAIQIGNGIEGSNGEFNALRREAFEILRRWHFDADPRGRGARGRIADELHQLLAATHSASTSAMSEHQTALLIAKVADYAVGAWDVSKVERSRKARGTLLHITEGMATVAERQAAGARHAAGVRSVRSLDAMVDAYRRLCARGKSASQVAVAAEAGIHRRTATRRWAEVIAAVEGLSGAECDRRCIDKKAASDPAASSFLQDRATRPVPQAGHPGAYPETSTVRRITFLAASVGRERHTSTVNLSGRSTNRAIADITKRAAFGSSDGTLADMGKRGAVTGSGPLEPSLCDLDWIAAREERDDDLAEIQAQEAFLAVLDRLDRVSVEDDSA